MVHGPGLTLLSSTQAVCLADPQEINDMADNEIIIAGVIRDFRFIFFDLHRGVYVKLRDIPVPGTGD
jgi:hypothetical protein